MTDELVTFEVAKLAKQKKFHSPVIYMYDLEGDLHKDDYDSNLYDYNLFKEIISAPPQSLLQRWLREKHGIYISVQNDITNDWLYDIRSGYPEATYKGNIIVGVITWRTYEEALEDALQTALNLIP